MTDQEIGKLVEKAWEAKKQAYAPYSHFHVGAALLAEDGTVYTGCNIENSSFSATNCAERTAIFKAVSEGKRAFRALALAADRPYTVPCGVCRQVMAEFCGGDFPIFLTEEGNKWKKVLLKELLPMGFRL